MIPNFGGMNRDELMAFWTKYTKPSRKAAQDLIGDSRKGYIGIASTLANYASNKATAMACRERGDIAAAQLYELCCDLIYKRLPKDLRW